MLCSDNMAPCPHKLTEGPQYFKAGWSIWAAQTKVELEQSMQCRHRGANHLQLSKYSAITGPINAGLTEW